MGNVHDREPCKSGLVRVAVSNLEESGVKPRTDCAPSEQRITLGTGSRIFAADQIHHPYTTANAASHRIAFRLCELIAVMRTIVAELQYRSQSDIALSGRKRKSMFRAEGETESTTCFGLLHAPQILPFRIRLCYRNENMPLDHRHPCTCQLRNRACDTM